MDKLPTYLITSPDNKTVIAQCSSGKVYVGSDYRAFLQFLVNSADSPMEAPRVVWNIADLLAIIKSVVPEWAAESLSGEDHRADWNSDGIHYRIFYQPSKFIGIHAGGWGEEVTFYELDQFYPDNPPINTLADVVSLSDALVSALASLGVTEITNLKSPVSVIESSGLLDAVYKDMPNPDEIPDGCKEYAELADAFGAWMTAYQVGYWKAGERYSYDICSCYPSIAARLVTLDGADYKFSKKMLDGNYGFLKGYLFINPDLFCPPIVASINEIGANPVGKIKGVFTLEQVRFIVGRGLGEFTLTDGWFITVNSGFTPLRSAMNRYFERRWEGALISFLAKRSIAGIIGRLGEHYRDTPTKYTNPVYHATVRNQASLMVGAALIDRGITEDELIRVNTDGFDCTRDLKLTRRSKLGQWRQSDSEPLLVLSSDKSYDGERCMEMVEAIKASPSSSIYGDVDLLSLSGAQDRYFPKFPSSGGELLRNKYKSQAPVSK